VKSPPELWTECSDAASLARHLGELGEIRITRLEPETAVAWEGEQASGTVQIEPAGWGTRVTLTAQARGARAPEADESPPLEETSDEARAETHEPRAVKETPDQVKAETNESRAVKETPDQVKAETNESRPVKETPDDAEAEAEAAAADAGVGRAAEPPGTAGGAPAAGPGWRRLIARARAWFRRPGAGTDPSPAQPWADGRPAGGSEDELAPEGREAEGIVERREAGSAAPAPAASVAGPEPASAEATHRGSPVQPERAEAVVDAATPPEATPLPDLSAVLAAALESLGRAHHRPFSRA